MAVADCREGTGIVKTRSTQSTVTPSRPATFNAWQKYLQKEIDKIRKTTLAGKL
jgi:hypothetical protein